MIKVKNVDLFYPDGKHVLENINLEIGEKQCVLLCGESGSGKSSLINLINGLATRYENCTYTGTVLLHGKDTQEQELYEISREISNVFQNPKTHFFNVDTTTELLFALENRGCSREEMKERLGRLLDIFPIQHLLGRNIFDLSGGEKQILSIASSYVAGTKIILLDEPSSNLDRHYTNILASMLKQLKEEGITILLAEHRLYYLKDLVDEVLYLKEGRIQQRFTGKDFYALSEEEREDYGLRCLDEPKLEKRKQEALLGLKKNVVIHHLSYSFPHSHRGIEIKNISFSTGSIIGIVGQNGSGKSSCMKAIMGLLKGAQVKIELRGKRLKKRELVQESNFVMQDVNHQLFTDSVLTEVTLNQTDLAEEKVEEVLKSLGLWKFKDHHPMSLSGGQKQRVAIASVLLAEPILIFFDEPTSGMDRKNMHRIAKLIRSCSKDDNIIFIISHDDELLNELVDDYINMEEFTTTRRTMFRKIRDYGKTAK